MEQAALDKRLAGTRSSLDTSTVNVATREGERMTVDQAISCALRLALTQPVGPGAGC